MSLPAQATSLQANDFVNYQNLTVAQLLQSPYLLSPLAADTRGIDQEKVYILHRELTNLFNYHSKVFFIKLTFSLDREHQDQALLKQYWEDYLSALKEEEALNKGLVSVISNIDHYRFHRLQVVFFYDSTTRPVKYHQTIARALGLKFREVTWDIGLFSSANLEEVERITTSKEDLNNLLHPGILGIAIYHNDYLARIKLFHYLANICRKYKRTDNDKLIFTAAFNQSVDYGFKAKFRPIVLSNTLGNILELGE